MSSFTPYLFKVPLPVLKKELSVPEGFWELWEVNHKDCNGCGSGWNAKLVPDTIYGLLIRIVCCIHDEDYTRGGTLEDKNRYDLRFKENLLKLIRLYDKWYYPAELAETRANTYYKTVSKLGHGAFNFSEEL